MRSRLVLAGALTCALALGGCLAAADSRVAELGDRLAPECSDLRMAITVADVFAPEKLRAAIAGGRAVIHRYCAKPPRSSAELVIFVAEVLRARQAIEAAKDA